jgi:hypothetical protein
LLLEMIVDTTDFSRVEFQLRPQSQQRRQKLKLHTTKVGGISGECVRFCIRQNLKDHSAEARGM